MSRRVTRPPTPPLALPIPESAAALGMSENHFRRHVLPHVRVILTGGKTLVSVAELERWTDQHSVRPGVHHAA